MIEVFSNLSASATWTAEISNSQWTLARASESLIMDSSCLTVIL